MDVRPRPESKLLRTTLLDTTDRLDTAWQESAEIVRAVLVRTSTADLVPQLVARASLDETSHTLVMQGLLYLILTDPENAPGYFQTLQATVRDDLASATFALGALCHEKMNHLQAIPYHQLLWLFGELVRLEVRRDIGRMKKNEFSLGLVLSKCRGRGVDVGEKKKASIYMYLCVCVCVCACVIECDCMCVRMLVLVKELKLCRK